MELYQLKTFVAVAEEAHLTRAAERLFTSQPAVSAHIKALEEELAVTLFNRTPKGMLLTPEGEHLLKQARHTLDAASDMLSQAKSLQNSLMGDVRIGMHTDFEFLRAVDLHAKFAENHPNLMIHFVRSISPEIVRDIRKGALDGGFFFGVQKFADLKMIRLAEVELAVAAPLEWRERVAGVDIEKIACLPWIYTTKDCPFRDIADEMFRQTPCDPPKVVLVDDEDAIRSLVGSGTGLALMKMDEMKRAEEQGYACRWQGEVPTIPLNFAVQTRRQNESLVRALIEEIVLGWSDATADENEKNVI